VSAPAAKPIEIILFPLECDDDERRNQLRLLSDDETQRAARFRFDKHRNRFISGRATIRQILAARGNCSPGDISFELNRYGKPSLAKPATAREIHFNASSSDTLGAIAISKAVPLGLDIEKVKSDNARDYDAIVASEFSSAENDWYQKHDTPGRIRVFFEFWTCKEAYLKALGIGLSGKLDSFSINLEGAEPRVSRTDLEDGGQSRFCLHRLGIDDDYVACLALPEAASRIELSYW
jgi:4'-phosphopantetheinyl transferase